MQIAKNAMKHYEEKYGKNPAEMLLNPISLDKVKSS